MSDDTELRARKAAEKDGRTVGRWIAEQVTAKVSNSWPVEVLAAIGGFPDFPEAEELRSGYGTDTRRERLD